jgi:hypothetical protein
MRSLCGVLVLGLVVSASYVVSAQAPLTVADYPAKMKEAAQANGALLKKLKSGEVAGAVADAKTAAAAFAEIEKFWAANKKADAVKLSQEAVAGYNEAATAAAAGDGMKALMAAGNAAATCKQCHGAYREGDPQAGYKFKAGSI